MAEEKKKKSIKEKISETKDKVDTFCYDHPVIATVGYRVGVGGGLTLACALGVKKFNKDWTSGKFAKNYIPEIFTDATGKKVTLFKFDNGGMGDMMDVCYFPECQIPWAKK